MKSFLVSIALLCFNLLPMVGQTGRYWIGSGAPYAIGKFDSSTRISPFPFDLFPKMNSDGVSNSAICSNNGDLLFISSAFRVFDHNGSVLKNSKNNYIHPNGLCLQSDENSWEILQNYYLDSTNGKGKSYKLNQEILSRFCSLGSCYDSMKYLPFGMYSSRIVRDSNNICYLSEKMKHLNKYALPTRTDFLDIKRIEDYSYMITGSSPPVPESEYMNRKLVLYNFLYKNYELSTLDSFVLNSFDFLPDSMKKIAAITGHKFYDFGAFLNRNRNKLFVKLYILFPDNIPIAKNYNKELLIEFSLDPLSGKFTSTPKFIFEQSDIGVQYGMPNKLYRTFQVTDYSRNMNAFSPDDSVFYSLYQEKNIVNGVTKKIETKVLAWKYIVDPIGNAKSIYSAVDYDVDIPGKSLHLPNINPFGGVSFSYLDRATNRTVYLHFKDANNPFSATQIKQNIPFNSNSIEEIQSPNLHYYEYLMVSKSIKYRDCGAYLSIKNHSDTSNGLSNFKWYVSKNNEQTEWDTFYGFTLPELFTEKSGKFLFKLHGLSTKGSGYSELYIDTLIVKIPKKPVSSFYAKDTIVCRYRGVDFINQSHSTDTIFNSYLWHFGDGNVSTLKEPNHIYSSPGIYTVSLFYKNGYCDSTLVKNQYIKIVEAPKPGFAFDTKQGCAPLKINFIDTVTLNIKHKEYFFSDSSIWKSINLKNPSFNYTFVKPGVYKVLQSLEGYSGCITRLDSVYINVSKGLTKFDTIHVNNSTVKNQTAFVEWRQNPAAVKYSILKNGILYKQTTDTFFNENEEYIKDANYSIFGIDSCGNSSSIGRIGKPIYLSGSVLGNNESAFLTFSPYLKWIGTDITYKLQIFKNNIWIDLVSQKTTVPINDVDFIKQSKLQVCYRVVANESSQANTYSYSNVLCLPYTPTIFIPNVFSPNGDGINDVFEPIVFGIIEYRITVINQWGEIVFKGDANQAWDGKEVYPGVYTVLIQSKSSTNKIYNNSITLTVLK